MTPRETLNHARTIAQGGSRTERETILPALDQLITKHHGDSIAREAVDIQRIILREISGPLTENRGVYALETEWAGVEGEGPRDPRLTEFLRRLFARLPTGMKASQLRAKVIARMRQWLEEEQTRIEQGTLPRNENRLQDLIKLIQAHPDHANTLGVQLKSWRGALFRAKFLTVSREIDNLLQTWSTDKAQERFNTLPSPPDEMGSQYNALQIRISTVARDNAYCQELFGRCERSSRQSSAQWEELRQLSRTDEELTHFLDRCADLPSLFKNRGEVLRLELAASAEKFLADTARGCHDLAALHVFQTQLGQLNPRFQQMAHHEWNQPALDAYELTLKQDIKRATLDLLFQVQLSLHEHRRLFGQLLGSTIQTDLPQEVIARLDHWLAMVGAIAETWRLVQAGERFELPTFQEDVIPRLLANSAQSAQQILDELDGIHGFVERNLPTKEGWEESLRQLDEILKVHPQHMVATRMKEEVTQYLHRWRFDDFLAKWDIRGFVAHCQKSEGQAPIEYQRLAQKDAVLRRMTELVRVPSFRDVSIASEWWKSWQDCLELLPSLAETPLVFSRTVLDAENARKQEWVATLDTLLEEEHAMPEQLRQAAETIASYPALRSYGKALQQKALVGEVEILIGEKVWDRAARVLGDLRNTGVSLDTVHRLTFLLKLERARNDVTKNALGDIVEKEWRNVLAYLPHEAPTLLLQVLEEAWRENWGRLTVLHTLSNGLSENVGITEKQRQELNLWAKWLTLEQELYRSSSSEVIRRLIRLLFPQGGNQFDSRLQMRMQRVITRWQEKQETRLLAWAYRALAAVHPPLMSGQDPLEELNRNGVEVATCTLNVLRSEKSLTRETLRDLAQQIEREGSQWQELPTLLDLLPFEPLDSPQLPRQMKEAKELVVQLQEVRSELEKLEDADLRQPEQRATQNRVRITLDAIKDKVASARLMLGQVQNLGELTEMEFLFNRFKKIAARCAQKDELLTPSLFADLAAKIDKMIELFTKVGVEGRGMWQAVSRDCAAVLLGEAGVLQEKLDHPNLKECAKLVRDLQEEENTLRATIIRLERTTPPTPVGGNPDPDDPAYKEALALFPSSPPRTKRGYWLWEQCLRADPMPEVLRASQSRLPHWVRALFTKINEGKIRQ